MSEIQTEHKPDNKKLAEDPFKDILEIQAEATSAAKRIFELAEKPTTNTIESNKTRPKAIRIAGAGLAVLAGAGITASTVAAYDTDQSFSNETTTYTVQPGDGLYDVADSIPGNDTVDPRDTILNISTNPVNIDVLKDGLEPGEQLTVPTGINGVTFLDK